MVMKFFSCLFISFFISFSNFCWTQNDQSFLNKQNSFDQFINLFTNLSCQDSLLCLQDIGFDGYPELLLDSTYSDFYKHTKDNGAGLLSCDVIPSTNDLYSMTIPFFRPYATFRVDCPDGYLVCLCHRFNSYTTTADLLFLEFDSFDKNGEVISRLFLPYLVNMSVGEDFLSVSGLLYVSNSKLCYITSSLSNSHDHLIEREIHYRIDSNGMLVFVDETKKQILKTDLKRERPAQIITRNY